MTIDELLPDWSPFHKRWARSAPAYRGTGKLHLWRELSGIEISTTSHPPQPELGRDEWSSDMHVVLPALGLDLRSGGQGIVGLREFAIACVRRLTTG